MLESMLKVDVHYRSKIGDVQRDLGSIMLNTNESFRSHCKLDPAVHSPSSSEEDIEDDDTDNDFWQNPTIYCSVAIKSTMKMTVLRMTLLRMTLLRMAVLINVG